MSEAKAADAVEISQRALAKCTLIEQEVRVLQEDTDDLHQRTDRLEGDLDE